VSDFQSTLAAQVDRVNEASERFGRVQAQNTADVLAAADRLEAAFNDVFAELDRRKAERLVCSVQRVRAQARMRAESNGVTDETELAAIEDVAEAELRKGASHEAAVCAAAGTYGRRAA
jgi:hypothetical protein